MSEQTNLEIFQNNEFIKRIAEILNDPSVKTANTDLISSLEAVPSGDFQKDLRDLFSFKQLNIFSVDENHELTCYEISSNINTEQVCHINIGKYINNQFPDNQITKSNDFHYFFNNEKNLYELNIYTGVRSFENSHNEYFDKVLDYDRIQNPQYYMTAEELMIKEEADRYSDFAYEEDKVEATYNEDGFLSVKIPIERNTNYTDHNISDAIEQVNLHLPEDNKINCVFNEDTFLSKNNNNLLLDALDLDTFSPDQLAECVDGIEKDTYSFLWNNLVQFNEITSNELSVKDFWNFIPENMQDQIVNVLSDQKTLKVKNSVKLIEITAKDEMKELAGEKQNVVYMIRSGKNSEKHLTETFTDKSECEKSYNNKSQKPDLRIPF